MNALEEYRQALSLEQAQSLAQTDHWSHVDKAAVHHDWDRLYQRIAPLIGVLPASAPAVQVLIAEHYRIVSRFYSPSRKAYLGMSLFYAEDAAMLNFHTAYHPDMVPFMTEAMAVYATAHL